MEKTSEKSRIDKTIDIFFRNKSIIIFIAFAVLFSIFLMFSTVYYEGGNIIIKEKLWGDFLSHIPLIRSFSLGNNFPPEYPLYSGEPIRYHFLFYFLVGMLEKVGMRIDIALNILSSIGMAGLLISIYLLAIKITKSKVAAWLSVVMFLFNSTFSWAYFIIKNGFSSNTFSQVINSTDFASKGPYDDQVLSYFWNLNVYTNQRHLAFSFFLMFVAIWAIYYSKKKWTFIIGVLIIGVMSILHKAILMILLIALGCLFFTNKERRKRVFASTLFGVGIALQGLAFLSSKTSGGLGITYNLGFIYQSTTWKELTFVGKNHLVRWFVYWFINLGILPFIGISGWVAAKHASSKKYTNKFLSFFHFFFSEERVWGVVAIIVFALGNIFSFSADPATNHKLINFAIMIFNIYAAWIIVRLARKKIYLKVISVIFTLFLVLGGIVDIFPIINDRPITMTDLPNDPTMQWIKQNTPPESRFYNITYETNPITLAGRRIYYGWDYFTWSIGYNLEIRKKEMQVINTGQLSKDQLCSYLAEHKLDYVYIDLPTELYVDVGIDKDYFAQNMVQVSPQILLFKIYSTQESCYNSINVE